MIIPGLPVRASVVIPRLISWVAAATHSDVLPLWDTNTTTSRPGTAFPEVGNNSMVRVVKIIGTLSGKGRQQN